MLFKPTYSRMFFSSDDGSGDGGGGGGEGTKPEGEKPKPIEFSDEQQKELDRRVRAARHQAESEVKAKLEQTAAQKAEAEKAERERKEAEARGEFDTVKASLETEAKTHKERAESAEAKAGEYEKLITPIVTERLESLKAASADVAKGFPAEASVLDQLAWLDDPRTKALIDRQDSRADALRRIPGTPPVNGNLTDTQRAEAEQKRLQLTGKYAL